MLNSVAASFSALAGQAGTGRDLPGRRLPCLAVAPSHRGRAGVAAGARTLRSVCGILQASPCTGTDQRDVMSTAKGRRIQSLRLPLLLAPVLAALLPLAARAYENLTLEAADSRRRYDIALSFAGEDREVARAIAHVATTNHVSVFLDEHHLWESWGKNLLEHLDEIYGGGAKYCVMLISEAYCQKSYTTYERRVALAHAMDLRHEYVLPVVLDNAWPEGLPKTTAFIDLREHSISTVAESVVRKVLGDNQTLTAPWAEPPHLEPVHAEWQREEPGIAGQALSPIQFANIKVAAECVAWEEEASKQPTLPRLHFRGGEGWYEDPIFDITIVNRSPEPRVITGLGIRVLEASFGRIWEMGGGGAEPILLDRVFQLPLPDIWRAIAECHRATGSSQGTTVFLNEASVLRMPDPVLQDAGSAYRFGLHLFDYTMFFPTNVILVFHVTTDQGYAESEPAYLTYTIGSLIPPVTRYRDIVQCDEASEAEMLKRAEWSMKGDDWWRQVEREAYRQWEAAGRPEGTSEEDWHRAEMKLRKMALNEERLRGAHVRPL